MQYGPETGGMPMSYMLININRLVRSNQVLKKLTPDQVGELCAIVYDEAEGWDGEYVSPERVVEVMAWRYEKVGLIPSRN